MDNLELTTLGELEEKEKDTIEKLKKKLRKKIEKKQDITAKEIYPHLPIKKRCTYCVGTIQAADFIPYFDTVVVDLRPLPNQDSFRDRYGLSVEEMVEYVDKKRIALRMRGPAPWYEGLDYLDPLLEKNPPNARRYRITFSYHDALYQEGLNKFKNFKSSGRWWEREYLDWGKNKHTFIDDISHKYALLGCYTSPQHVKDLVTQCIMKDDSPDDIYKIIHLYCRTLAYPRINSFDGSNHLPDEDMRILKTKSKQLPIENNFPLEIGKALRVDLDLGGSHNLEEVTEAPAKDWFNAVNDLNEVLERQDESKIQDRGTAISNLIKETKSKNRIIKRKIARVKKGIRVGLSPTSVASTALSGVSFVGISGPYAQFLPDHWSWIVGGIALGGTLAAGKIAETLVHFKKPSHVVSYYKLAKRFA